jgi:anti-anti-sigma regulatory factor
VSARISPTEARFTVRDEGRGFDPRSLPDPNQPGGMDRVSGRGITLMRSFMDEVVHNPIGNEVTLVRRRQAAGGKRVKLSEKPSPYLHVEQEGSTLIITPLRTIGTLADASVRTMLAEVMALFEQPGVTNVLIDFARLKYFGASVIELLRAFGRKAESCGSELALCNLSAVGGEVLRITNFETQWPAFLSRERAIASLGDHA